jgi:Transglycosylase SLT domain
MRGRGWILVTAAAAVLTACGGSGGPLADTTETSTTVESPPTVDTTTPTSTSTRSNSDVAAIPTDRLHGPTSATVAAQVLEKVERGIRATDRDIERLRKLGREQQLAYRAISIHPEWVQEVVAAIAPELRSVVQANIDAGTALRTLTGQAPPGFPDWDILTPEPADTLRAYYAEGEAMYGVPWAYLAAIHLSETRMGRIHGNSSAGAQGPMQFIPATWAAYGKGDINSNHDSILAAARYLAANGAPADIDRALFRYNNDDRYVAAIKAYAGVMLADPLAYDGYYQWRVFYATTNGTFVLPEGWTGG